MAPKFNYIEISGDEKEIFINESAVKKMRIRYINEGLKLAGKNYLDRLDILARKFSVTPKSIEKTLTELNKKIGV